jgi:rubredoxin
MPAWEARVSARSAWTGCISIPRRCKHRSSNISSTLRPTHAIGETLACSVRHQVHSIRFHQLHHSQHTSSKANIHSNPIIHINNHNTPHPHLPPTNRPAGRRLRPHRVQQLTPNFHVSQRMRCTFNRRLHTTRPAPIHCNRPRLTPSNRPALRRFTSTIGSLRPKTKQPRLRRLQVKQGAVTRNQVLRIPATRRAASVATVHASERRKAGTNLSLRQPAPDPCTQVRRFHRAPGPRERLQVVATSGIAATSSSGETWKAIEKATRPRARQMRGNSTAGNPEVKPFDRLWKCRDVCVYLYDQARGHSLDCITAGLSHIFHTVREKRECLVIKVADCLCFVRKSSLKIPLVRLLLLFDSRGRIVDSEKSKTRKVVCCRDGDGSLPRKKEKDLESLVTPHEHTMFLLPRLQI